jgi:uracil-DNA glycosylase family 4
VIQRIAGFIGAARERLERRTPRAYVARAMRESPSPLERLEREIPECAECPRLAGFLASLRTRHPAYWNRPVPGFGDRRARIVIVGLAPGMHGANRSGRPFFMDASGEWLYGELARRGLWDEPRLTNVYIVNAVKCLPPVNKPTGDEQTRCRPWLERELDALSDARVVLALGRIAHSAVLRCWKVAPLGRHPFVHGRVEHLPGRPALLASYHPSRQNTNTGVLTKAMWQSVFARAIRLAH